MKCFHALIKPASSLCNMRCRYCFYQDVAGQRNIASYGHMSTETADTLIRRIFEWLHSGDTVVFAFQGGEPTLAGLDFFRHFTEAAGLLSAGRFSLQFSIQTNGLIIDREWAAFFAANSFLVGVSVDGYSGLHDYLRPDSQGKGTYNRVRSALRCLQEAKVEYNILSVISAQMATHPQSVMKQYQRDNAPYIQLIPCLAPLDNSDLAYEPSPSNYALFMKSIFAQWLEALQKGKPMHIRQLDNLADMLKGISPEQCGLSGHCTPQFVVESNGNVYPCDFYVLDEYCCGNVIENTVEEIIRSQGMQRFIADDTNRNPRCASCPVLRFCGGGCRRYRRFYSREKDYCPYGDFLEYALPILKNIMY